MVVSSQNERSEELFNTLSQNKKKKKRKLLRTIISMIVIVALILAGIVIRLRNKVEDKFAVAGAQVLTYNVSAGTIHSLVSGSGTLEYVDLETLSVPTGVEITEVIAQRNQQVRQGDLLATVDMSTVLTALADLQDQLGTELADMIHYIVAIAAINHIDLTKLIIEKDRKASVKYNHTVNLETFLSNQKQ